MISISAYFISGLSALGLGLIFYFWQETIGWMFVRYYQSEAEICEASLKAAQIKLDKQFKYLLILSGPLLGSVLSLLIPVWWGKLLGIFLSLLIFKRLGRSFASSLKNRRLNRIKEELVDVLGLVANALRAGLSLLQALEMAAQEMPGPVADEFKQVISENRLGETLENAMINLKRRVPLKEIYSLVDAVLILRETGGNLIETFEILIQNLREEQRVKAKIKTLTMQGIAQAVVIVLLPFGLAGVLYTMAPQYIMPLFEHWIGWICIAVMLTLQTIGAFTMKKMVTIEI